MKKLIAVALALALILCGCSGEDSGQPRGGATATPEPSATPAPTPIIRLSASEYTYRLYMNTTIRLRFLVPAHWTEVNGTNVVSFREPVNGGDVGALVSLAVKSFSKEVDDARLQSEITAYMGYIGAQYESFSHASPAADTFIERSGYSVTYTGAIGGTAMKGYVAFIASGGKIYALHFRSEESRYADLSTVLEYIKSSFAVITATG